MMMNEAGSYPGMSLKIYGRVTHAYFQKQNASKGHGNCINFIPKNEDDAS